MSTVKTPKSEVWKNIMGLFLTQKKTLALVVFVSLLSTGANLIEPLIYREAINDISGLFVQKAKDEAAQQMNDSTAIESSDSTVIENEETDDLLNSLLVKEKHKKNKVAPPHTRTSHSNITLGGCIIISGKCARARICVVGRKPECQVCMSDRTRIYSANILACATPSTALLQ